MKKTASILQAFGLAAILFSAPAAQALPVWENKKLGLQVNIDGDFYLGLFGAWVDSNESSRDPFDIKLKGEIDLGFKGTLGKTFSYGAKLEIRPSKEKKVVFDEYYGFVKDKRFGSIYLGATKSPAGKRAVRAPEFYAPGVNAVEGSDFTPLKLYAKNETDIDYDEDVHKIIYYTPRLYGFEFGISFAPDIAKGNNGNNAKQAAKRTPDGGKGTHKDAISLNLNYQQDFSSWGIAASGGYLTAKGKGNIAVATTPPTLAAIPALTLNAWNVGLRVNVGDVSIGSGFLWADDVPIGGENAREKVWIIGANHQVGKFTYGAHYRLARRETIDASNKPSSNLTDQEIEFGGHYAFNDYIQLSAGVELLSSKGRLTDDKNETFINQKALAVNSVLTITF